ncbi:LOW QUALITY PROTEIN: zinc finger protein 385B [Brachyhypopomus gauderio]|uniref:LOW QUALITY PROTEIN: zinc finger protein 385B n=1 Tax=Brachyhypopomus gauderio TaxID=698409 RepID=UPI004042B41B
MKTPLSPAQLMENSPPPYFPLPACVELEEEASSGLADVHARKKLLYSLCEVCNIQLNSAAQAQTHYNGKSHLRRVKQLNHGEVPPANASASANSSGSAPPPLHTVSSSTGSSCHSNTLPTLVRTPPLMMQSTLDMKSFMPFPVDSSTPVGLFANFSTMDPVQKAVINHTFGVSIPPKKKQVISCNICQLRFNSDSQAEAHYKGSKHAKKLKAQETTKTKPRGGTRPGRRCKPISTVPTPSSLVTDSSSDQSGESDFSPPRPFVSAPAAPPAPSPVSVLSKSPPSSSSLPVEAAGQRSSPRSTPKPASPPEPSQESEEEKAKKLLYCSLCKVAVNSLSQLEAHNTGSKHKTMLEARNGAGPIKAYPRPGSKLKMQANVLKGSGLQNKTFHCEICDVHVNSEIQLKQHISSRRHKDRVAGKPLKPKYSPYNKQQRSTGTLAAKLALQKDLVKPISPAFISTPFSPTTVSPISLHPRPNASIFQTATLPASFLRAAPGPIRPSTGSILFAPY